MSIVFAEIRPVDPFETHQTPIRMLEGSIGKILLHQTIHQFIQVFKIRNGSGADLSADEAPEFQYGLLLRRLRSNFNTKSFNFYP